MTKKLFSVLLAAALSLVLALGFTGCAGGSDDMKSAKLQTEDFTYILKTAETEYTGADLNAKAPFNVTLSIEYTGSEESIDLWCVDDLGVISMENGSGQPLTNSDSMYHRDTTKVTLTKGTPYTIQWTGAEEYKEYDGFPSGDYKVVAYINFSTDSAYDSIQENTLDVSLKIK